jgi:hypothetical protein
MYIEDGSNIDYFHADGDATSSGMPKFKNLYAWGWLGNKVEHKGWEDQKLKRKVIKKLANVRQDEKVDHYMGFHCCEMCGFSDETAQKDGMFCGSIKIDHNEKVYCCPAGVEHYIKYHDYKPADEVIDAIFNGKYLTFDDLEEIGKKDPEVIKAVQAEEERIRKLKAKWERENQERIELGKKRAADPEWNAKLKKRLMDSMFGSTLESIRK